MSGTDRFANLTLDENVLHTPEGDMPLSAITRAEFVRVIVRDGTNPSTKETSEAAVAGGALVGGALLGGIGAIGGGLLGSTVKNEVEGSPKSRERSVSIVFETPDLTYTMDVDRADEARANKFVTSVKRAARGAR